MRYALVENGVVTNVIEAPEGYVAPFGQAIATDAADIGWTYMQGQWLEPEVAEQKKFLPDLTARQFWLAALELGITDDGLLASISDVNDPLYIEDESERAAVAIDIRKATSFRRDYPLVDEMAQAQGIPPEQMDSLWAWAAQIE